MFFYFGNGDSDKEKENDKFIKFWFLCVGERKRYRERIIKIKWIKMKGGKMI